VVLLSAPVVAYDGYLVLTDPRLTTGQAGYASPDPLRYLVAFGTLSVLAPLGAYLQWRRRAPYRSFLYTWILATLVQIYIPRAIVPFQMQLILGVQLPLVVLAVEAVAAGRARLAGRPAVAAAAAAVLLVLSTFTSAYHLGNVFKSLRRHALPEYMEETLAQAIEWMEGHTEETAVVLSSPEVAPFIPVLANNRMFTGNYEAPTAGFEDKRRATLWLVSPAAAKTDAEILQFFEAQRIDYVFYDTALAALGGDSGRARLEAVPGVQLVFRNAAASVYRVRATAPIMEGHGGP
jgi:hypothetical protein